MSLAADNVYSKPLLSHNKSANETGIDDVKEIPLPNENGNTNIKINDGDYFEWKNVNVSIEGKQILYNICGRVGSGQLLGILGGSGAGKTTLLNAISGRILNKNPTNLLCIEKCKRKPTAVTGSVGFKQHEFKLGDSDQIKHISAYVMQNDIMCPTATGHEALLFSSKLRSKKDASTRLEIIDSVTTSLKLINCANTKIGNDAIKGMSGGERKRTSVGVELVVEPSLIFLDEPTSGLDSFTALKTLEILKDLTAQQGKQVIATIHQPSSDIFSMIDVLLLLSEGHVVYFGPVKQALSYFERIGYQCPEYTNIAEYVVNSVQQKPKYFIQEWKKYEREYIDLDFKSYGVLYPQKQQNAGFCTQAIEIFKREFQILARDPRPSRIRLAQTIVFSLFVGILYFDLPYNQQGLRDRFGAVFFLTVNSSMTGLISTIIVFPEQRLLFERERNANMYYTTTYLIAKLLVSLPEAMLFTLFYQLICYWMVGFDSSFFQLYVSILLSVLSTGSVGFVVGCFANNPAEGMQVMPVAFVPFLLFTNFMVSLSQIPAWIRWIQWIDPFKYVVDCLSITEFQGQLHDCDVNGANCIYDGDEYLNELGAGYADEWLLKSWINTWMDSVYFDWLMLLVLIIGFRFIACVILVNRNGF